MKVGLQILSGSSLLGAGEVVNNACMLARNLILARLLDKADFGIAATCGLVVALFELAGKMSFGQQVIQSPAGDEPQFLHSAHACQALAGMASAALILLFARPLAHWFGIEAHWGALMLLAVIPLCTGFASLEVYRMVRHLRFGPLVLTDTVPQVLITLATWPLAAWFRDYRALLCLLVAKAGLSLIASHLVAERPYRLCWQFSLVRESFRFGWPLLVSSFVMFGVFQGDQMLVAGAYSMSDLGIYAVAATLAMAPSMAIFKISGPVTLPVLAKAQGAPVRFRAYYRLYAQALALFGALFVVTMILGGETVVTLLFGQKYRVAAALATWLAVGQALRILRGAPTCAALARGDTVNTLLSNLCRLSGLALAVPVVLLKLDLRWVAVAGGVGECLALAASLIQLRLKHDLHVGDCLYPTGLLAVLASGAYFVETAFALRQTVGVVFLALLGCTVSLAVFGAVFPDLRRVSLSLLSEVGQRLRCFLRNVRVGGAVSRV